MNNYPPPGANPHCKCTNPMQAFFCFTGHMLECHYPYACDVAGCCHLLKYDFSHEEALELQIEARRKMEAGKLPPYPLPGQLDSNEEKENAI